MGDPLVSVGHSFNSHQTSTFRLVSFNFLILPRYPRRCIIIAIQITKANTKEEKIFLRMLMFIGAIFVFLHCSGFCKTIIIIVLITEMSI